MFLRSYYRQFAKKDCSYEVSGLRRRSYHAAFYVDLYQAEEYMSHDHF